MTMLPRTWKTSAERCSNLLQNRFDSGPGLVAGFLVGLAGVRGFAGAHEAVACSFVGDGLVGFAGLFHELFGFRNGGIHAGVVAAVETVDRRLDAGDVRRFVRAGAVED